MPQKKQIKTVVLIGAGNVASHLGIAITKAGFTVLQVYSKHSSNTRTLAQKLSAQAVGSITAIRPDADIYIIAVNDDTIENISDELKLRNKIVVHTSGSTGIDALRKASSNRGVIYPLQTLSKDADIDFSEVPLFIEANNKTTENRLSAFACNFSKIVNRANSEKRKYIHLAAVFACNFSNHMYVIAEKLSREQKIPFDAFAPLIRETTRKALSGSPKQQQTGPAIRNDKKTMKLQEKLLQKHPELKKLYKLISKNIRKF